MQTIDGVRVWGNPDEGAVNQAIRCSKTGDVYATVLMADHHVGYSQPIGCAVAYRGMISPSGVGYDIACGNKAVRTNIRVNDIRGDVPRIMDEVFRRINFGVGRKNLNPVDHPLFDDPTWQDLPTGLELRTLAWWQLGTVGSGNHYVDIFADENGAVWIGVHFGSRGFGYKVASGFLNLAAGRPFDGKSPGESMDQEPTVLSLTTDLGQSYLAAMRLAGRYAYAGRDYVVDEVLNIMGATAEFEVHNNHNFAWIEEHNGEQLCVVRKGATPNWSGQVSFVGGSMGDISAIVRGKNADENKAALYSTMHGAGRVMSRTKAAGKFNWKTKTRSGGIIDWDAVRADMRSRGIELRGAGADEAPAVYKDLRTVLAAHAETMDILHTLMPLGIAMAGSDEHDPYKD